MNGALLVRATCNSCVWTTAGSLSRVAPRAGDHDFGEHRVTLWDTDTSHLPREMWKQATS